MEVENPSNPVTADSSSSAPLFAVEEDEPRANTSRDQSHGEDDEEVVDDDNENDAEGAEGVKPEPEAEPQHSSPLALVPSNSSSTKLADSIQGLIIDSRKGVAAKGTERGLVALLPPATLSPSKSTKRPVGHVTRHPHHRQNRSFLPQVISPAMLRKKPPSSMGKRGGGEKADTGGVEMGNFQFCLASKNRAGRAQLDALARSHLDPPMHKSWQLATYSPQTTAPPLDSEEMAQAPSGASRARSSHSKTAAERSNSMPATTTSSPQKRSTSSILKNSSSASGGGGVGKAEKRSESPDKEERELSLVLHVYPTPASGDPEKGDEDAQQRRLNATTPMSTSSASSSTSSNAELPEVPTLGSAARINSGNAGAMVPAAGTVSTSPLPKPADIIAFDSLDSEIWRDSALITKKIKDVAGEWAERSETEAAHFTSVTLSSEWMLTQVIQATQGLGLPNPVRTAVVMSLLYRCLPVSGRGRQVMERLYSELFSSIYDVSPDDPDAISTDVRTILRNQTFYEKAFLFSFAYKKVDQERRHLAALWSTKHRFINLHYITTSRLRKGYAFRTWRGTTRRNKQVREAISGFVRRFERRDRVQTIFYAWRQFSTQHRAMREYRALSENLATLTHAAALRNELMHAYEHDMDDIKHKLAASRDHVERLTLQTTHSSSLLGQYEERLARWKELAFNIFTYFTEISDAYRNPLPEKMYRHYGGHHDMAEKVLLHWVNSTISTVAPPFFDPVMNFSADLRDGSAYVYLLHALSNREFTLDILDHDSEIRAEAVLTKCRDLLTYMPPINFYDIINGTPDLNLALVFFLWARYGKPTLVNFDKAVLKQREEPFSAEKMGTETTLTDTAWRKLNEDYHKAGDDMSTWMIHRRVLAEYVSMVLVCRAQGSTLMGQDGDKETGLDLESFVNIKLRRVKDLLEAAVASEKASGHHGQKTPAMLDVRLEQALNLLKQVLKKNEHFLRSVFRTYTGCKMNMPLHKAQLDFQKYVKMCTDCKLYPQNYNKPTITKLFLKAKKTPLDEAEYQDMMEASLNDDEEEGSSPGAGSGAGGGGNINQAHHSASEWVECMIRFAVLKYGPIKGKRTINPVHTCAEQFFEKDLIPYAMSTDTNEFRAMVWSESIQAIIKLHRPTIHRLFKAFAKKQSGSDVAALNVESFAAIWRECNLVDSNITTQTYSDIFDQLANQKGYMIYSVFEHAVVALAAYKFPSPFLAMHQRLRNFLERVIIPGMSHSKLLKNKDEKR